MAMLKTAIHGGSRKRCVNWCLVLLVPIEAFSEGLALLWGTAARQSAFGLGLPVSGGVALNVAPSSGVFAKRLPWGRVG